MTSSVSWRTGVWVEPLGTEWCMVKPSLTAVQGSSRMDVAQGVHRGLLEVMERVSEAFTCSFPVPSILILLCVLEFALIKDLVLHTNQAF